MRKTLVLICVSLLVASLFAEDSNIDAAELKKKADRTIRIRNVSGRSEVDNVFVYTDWLLENGKQEEAMKYIDEGLQLYPWALDYQLIYSKLLKDAGKPDEAKAKAELVYKYAEKDALIEQAGQMLGKDDIPAFDQISKIPGNDFCVVLIPIQGADKWLLVRLKEELENTLKIPVYIQTIKSKFPDATRDAYTRAIDLLREQLNTQLNSPEFVKELKALGYNKEDMKSDKKVIEIVYALIAQENPMAAMKFSAELKAQKGLRSQWDSDRLRTILFNAEKPFKRENVAYLAVTPVDIYSDDYNFLFGSANGNGGVMSYHRFTADFSAGDPPNQERLVKRTKMQCLSSIGHIFKIKRCTTPTCARAYPNSLREHDAKSGELCPQCAKAFEEVFKKDN